MGDPSKSHPGVTSLRHPNPQSQKVFLPPTTTQAPPPRTPLHSSSHAALANFAAGAAGTQLMSMRQPPRYTCSSCKCCCNKHCNPISYGKNVSLRTRGCLTKHYCSVKKHVAMWCKQQVSIFLHPSTSGRFSTRLLDAEPKNSLWLGPLLQGTLAASEWEPLNVHIQPSQVK